MKLRLGDLVAILTVVAALLGAGMYIGKLEQRIAALERAQGFIHGDLSPYLAQGSK